MIDQATSAAKATERSVITKLMWGVVPFLALLYMFNILDRTNVSIAALTMQKDLGFSKSIYGFGAGIFFIGYFILEVPSNLIMQRVGARRWIARIMISWGIISASMMFVRTPISFYSLRFLLGLAEAGFYPGIILYLTYWVPSVVRTQVIARFLAITAFAGIAGPFLGAVLLRLDGVGHLHGWQWLFLVEGLPSVALGALVLAVLPNSPAEAAWLTADEKAWIITSLARDNSSKDRLHHDSLLKSLSDPRILHLCLIFIVTSTGGNMIGFFAPQLLDLRSGSHWSNSFISMIMFVPALLGAIAMMIAAYFSDRSGNRRLHVALGYFVAGLGFLACVYAPSASWVVAALALNTLGERCAAGSYWAVTTDLMGVKAAAGCIAFINSVGNLGGFVGPWLMGIVLDKTHGNYNVGLYTAFVLLVVGAALSLLLRRRTVGGNDSPGSVVTAGEASEDTIAAIAQPEQSM